MRWTVGLASESQGDTNPDTMKPFELMDLRELRIKNRALRQSMIKSLDVNATLRKRVGAAESGARDAKEELQAAQVLVSTSQLKRGGASVKLRE